MMELETLAAEWDLDGSGKSIGEGYSILISKGTQYTNISGMNHLPFERSPT